MDTVNPFPSAPMAEKAVLSIIFQYPEDFMRQARGEGITAQHFHHHAVLFDAMRDFHEQHKTLDLSVFVQHLHSAGMLDRVGGPSAVTDVYTYQPHTANWSIHLQQLREAFALRTALLASQSLQDASDSGEAIQTAETALNALRDAVRGQSRAVNAKEASKQFLERLLATYHSGSIPGAPTGIDALDLVSGGLKPGEFWVIGGKPSRGKTVFMLQIAANLITEQIPVVVFTLEVTRGEIIGRLVSCIGKIDYGVITQPKNANKLEMGCIETTVKTIATAPLWVDDSPNISLDAIRNESIRVKDLNHGQLGLVVVDYIQLIRQGRNRNENREEEVARVSGGFKQLAKELKCPVISATQLNEQGQSRESRAIEQDADTCLYIVEDGIKVVKMRNGVRNDLLPLELDGKYQRFSKRYITPK